jgi:hypothetical protein
MYAEIRLQLFQQSTILLDLALMAILASEPLPKLLFLEPIEKKFDFSE